MKDLEKEIYRKYPVLKRERTCAREKQHRDGLRAEYRKRLYEQAGEKRIWGENTEDQPKV
jgi:hypothetical protein